MNVQSDIVTEFDHFSSDYTKNMIVCVPHYETLLAHLVSDISPDLEVAQILDFGSGNGNTTAQLLSRYPTAQYTLVDASPEMLRICKERFGTVQMTLAESFFDDYDIDQGHYDLAAASFSLHHVDGEQKKRLFSHIADGLRPGGIFVYVDLMMHKDHPDHPALIQSWQNFVMANETSGETWTWLMEHYAAFDHPDNLDDQLKWLVSIYMLE